MKKKIILSFLLTLIMLLTVNVEAKVISKDEIEDDSYVIGKYLYTRDKNTENNYNGELTTPLMLLAAKSIDGGLDDIKVYYKTFLGEWINGITGESIIPPETFEIENRNLRDILPRPELRCNTTLGLCEAAINIDGKINSSGYLENLYEIGTEYYMLKDAEGNFPTENANYIDGKFTVGNTTLTPEIITDFKSQEYKDLIAEEKFYQIVSRVYYLDGDKKIYSDYSEIISNGIITKLNLTTSPTLNANITNVAMYKNPADSLDITYYNVEFSLSNIDTEKYMVKRYEVYALENKDDFMDYYDTIVNLEGGNNTYLELYLEKVILDKYNTPHFFNHSLIGGWYLTAEKDGETVLPEIVNDVSLEKAYSIRFDSLEEDSEIGTNLYFAKVYLCDKNNQNVCYNTLTSSIAATKVN